MIVGQSPVVASSRLQRRPSLVHALVLRGPQKAIISVIEVPSLYLNIVSWSHEIMKI